MKSLYGINKIFICKVKPYVLLLETLNNTLSKINEVKWKKNVGEKQCGHFENKSNEYYIVDSKIECNSNVIKFVELKYLANSWKHLWIVLFYFRFEISFRIQTFFLLMQYICNVCMQLVCIHIHTEGNLQWIGMGALVETIFLYLKLIPWYCATFITWYSRNLHTNRRCWSTILPNKFDHCEPKCDHWY